MNLDDLINRKPLPSPWEEGDNIPWHEAGFSQRMLREHLSQAHDSASRRFEIIDRQVAWIQNVLPQGRRARILDLACGPGFYTERLAKLGHTCYGIDYSPASIEYASSTAQKEGLSCQYTCHDLRLADFPDNIDLVMLIYGELNVFRPQDARLILEKTWGAMNASSILLLEPHTHAMVKQIGKEPSNWYSSHGGLFFDGPHLVLKDHSWDEKSRVATIRYYVVHANDGQVERYAESLQAYSNSDYRSLLSSIGFSQIEFLPALSKQDPQAGIIAITARK